MKKVEINCDSGSYKHNCQKDCFFNHDGICAIHGYFTVGINKTFWIMDDEQLKHERKKKK